MDDFHFRDLFNAAAWAAILYVVFNAIISFRSGRPLVESINPHRRYLLPFAGTLLAAAAALLERASDKYDKAIPTLLEKLVREEQAPAEVIGAASCAIFAVAVVLVFVWCQKFLPRDPRTFSQSAAKPYDEYRRAMRHYIRWSRQLDYVVLLEVSAGAVKVLVEEWLTDRAFLERIQKVDPMRIGTDQNVKEEAEKQRKRWQERAETVIAKWDDLDRMLLPARHGANVHIFFDLEYGGLFIEKLRGFKADDGSEVALFLFAACVDQHGINTSTASDYFRKLCDAIKHVRGGSTSHYK